MKRVLPTSTRSLSNFTTKVNLVHAKSPLGCGAPSRPDPVRERRHPTRAFAGARACGSAGSANLRSTRPPSFGGGGGGGGCDHGNHKPQSLHRKAQLPATPAPETARRLPSTGKTAAGARRGPARAPSRLGQSLETGRNFPERKRRVRAGPAARSAPASAAPQLPQRQEAPAPPAPPASRPARAQARGPAREAGRPQHRSPPRARFRAGSRRRPPPARTQEEPLGPEPAPA